MLGVGLRLGGSDQHSLSPCSEDKTHEEDVFLSLGSNIWESIKIPYYLGENIEDLFSIETHFNSFLPNKVLSPQERSSVAVQFYTKGMFES